MTAPYCVRALTPADFPQASRLLARRWSREADCGRSVDQERDYALILPLRTGDHPKLHGLFEDEELVAMWELDPTSPGPGWSASERQERSVGLFLTRTVRNAPPGDVWDASPLEIRVGDWLVLDSTAYEITNMFSPGFDSSAKRVILRGHAPQVVKTRHEIVRPYEALHRGPRRPL